ncbi:MAG: YifB family Mg chelatase-like AAA ATPase [Pseudomonadales bacterium]|nr:YifB family Mg chelatase-like AAA ATPase [Pseudomonadales bacterium]
MSLSIIHTRANVGIEAPAVTVETHLSNGLPAVAIVGLPETAVRESRERVRSALLNAGFDFPARRITINLAPADLPKGGGRFDLAIALGILTASGQLPGEVLQRYEVLGELALSGELRPVSGIIPAVLAAKASGRVLIVPQANQQEAELIPDVSVYCAGDIRQVCAHFLHGRQMRRCQTRPPTVRVETASSAGPDISEVKGQQHACRALQIAAAGRHNLLLIGPPGTGKTLLANCLPGLLPALTQEQALEAAVVRSVAGERIEAASWLQPPFRAPHHSSSNAALVGGARQARPGEITLAHQGVLFLDELTEFQRPVLDSLREPLEAGKITLGRAAYRLSYPASFQLLAAMNPCPCGFHGDPERACRCTAERIQRYLGKISGPLLDRIDLSLEVPRQPLSLSILAEESEHGQEHPVETSSTIRQRIIACRERQYARSGKLNRDLTGSELDRVCRLRAEDRRILEATVKHLRLSPRACYRLLRTARTVADYESCEQVRGVHLAEAVSYRMVDRYFLGRDSSF